MKKTLLTIISFVFLASVSAQLIVDELGRVGIGVQPDGSRLTVNGSVRASSVSCSHIFLGSTASYLGTSYSYIPITFRVNNVLAGYTGHPGNTNVSFGYGALSNLRGSNNTATGYQALYSNISGNSNTANGYQALYNNTTGYGNIANGYQALYYNTTGSWNIAIGTYALEGNNGNENTAIGLESLYYNYTGFGNTANGSQALYYNSTGSYNTAYGYSALVYNETGSFNTAIGLGSGGAINNLNNTTAIGYGAYATGSNEVRIGNSSVTTIGGQVNWTGTSDGRAKKNIKANVPGLAFINALQPVTYNWDLDAMDDLMGINKTKNSRRDSIEQAMPKELKEIIKKSREAKEKQIQTGFIAQDVEKTAKSIGYNFSGVDAPEDGKGAYGLRYAEFVVPLVKAVQELSEQNDKQKEVNDKQQKQIEELTELVNKLLGKDATTIYRSADNETSTTGLPELPANNFSSSAALYQNIPNPFSQATQIKFYIPENVRTAQLCIYSLQGAQLKSITLSQRGNGSETISGSQFSAGIYLYALIADGKEVDVKRMILTE